MSARSDRARAPAAVTATLAGVLFAIGLALSGMTRPDKVIGFLDLFGAWDPSLAFVMGGAVVTHALTRRLVLRRPAPLFEARFQSPDPAPLWSPALIGGSALFGVGWGLAGYCPGPAIVALGSGALGPIVFVAAMLVGITLTEAPFASPFKTAPPA